MSMISIISPYRSFLYCDTDKATPISFCYTAMRYYLIEYGMVYICECMICATTATSKAET